MGEDGRGSHNGDGLDGGHEGAHERSGSLFRIRVKRSSPVAGAAEDDRVNGG